jgi:hypothetical protein
MANVPFDPDVEQLFVGALDDVMASTVLEKAEKEIEARKKKASRKKSKGKVTTPPATEPADGPVDQDPTNKGDDGATTNVPANDGDDEESGDEASFVSYSN